MLHSGLIYTCLRRIGLATLVTLGIHLPVHAQAEVLSHSDLSTLSQLVEMAVNTHPSVQAKVAELGGSAAVIDSAKWQYYPSFSVQSERNSNLSSNNSSGSRSTTLRLQQPLWQGGRLTGGVELAETKRQAAEQALRDTRDSIALKTLDAWQAWKISQGRQQLAAQLIEQLDRLNGMMERRVEQQVSPPIELQQLKTRLSQTQIELLSARSAQESSRQRLLQWAGANAAMLLVQAKPSSRDTTATNISSSFDLSAGQSDMSSKFEIAVNRAPGMMKAMAEIQAMEQEVALKQSEKWPSVYARLDRQFNKSDALFGNNRTENTASIGLQYTLGAGLSLRSQVDTLQAKVQALKNEHEALRRQLLETYQTEWRDYQTNLERTRLAQSTQTSHAALSESYSRLFIAGRRSWLDLLNAVREEYASEQTLSDLAVQVKSSQYRMQLYLGEMPWQTQIKP